MSFYLYCLTDPTRLAIVSAPRGIADARIEIIAHGSVSPVVSRIDRLPSPVGRVDLERHDAVNRFVLGGGVCVPLRYGTILPSREACVAFVDEDFARWCAAIERLRDRVELSVHVVLPAAIEGISPPEDRPDSGPGARYLRRRRAIALSEDRANEQAGVLAGELGGCLDGLAEVVEVERRGRLVSMAALLRRADFASASARVGAIAKKWGGRWNVGEPWPPYSFVTEGRNAPVAAPDAPSVQRSPLSAGQGEEA